MTLVADMASSDDDDDGGSCGEEAAEAVVPGCEPKPATKSRRKWRSLKSASPRASSASPSAHALPEGRIDGQMDDLPDAKGAVHWAESDIEALHERGMEVVGVDLQKRMIDSLKRGLVMRTDYSGIGAAEEAADKMLTAVMSRDENVKLTSITVQRSGDILPMARNILASHVGPCQPGCVQADMVDRLPRTLRRRLERLLKKHLHIANARLSRLSQLGQGKQAIGKMAGTSKGRTQGRSNGRKEPSKTAGKGRGKGKSRGSKKSPPRNQGRSEGQKKQSKKQVFDEQGKAFMLQAKKCLLASVASPGDSAGEMVADCLIHRKKCPVIPKVPKMFRGLVCNIAGISCFDFSTMGNALRWLGKSALPFLAWARERLLAGEHFVLVECVKGFDHETMEKLFDGIFKLTVIRVSPSLYGLPTERKRKYMVLLATDKLKWIAPIETQGPENVYHSIFGRKRNMTAEDHLRAPSSEIAASIAKQATDRGLPQQRRSGREWSAFQCLTPAMKKSVQAHEEYLTSKGINSDEPVIVNLIQSPGYIQPVIGMFPALLKGSRLWSIQRRRLLLPMEHLEVMGFQIYKDDKYQCRFTHALQMLSDTKLRQFAGNTMHLRVVGTCIMYILAATQKV